MDVFDGFWQRQGYATVPGEVPNTWWDGLQRLLDSWLRLAHLELRERAGMAAVPCGADKTTEKPIRALLAADGPDLTAAEAVGWVLRRLKEYQALLPAVGATREYLSRLVQAASRKTSAAGWRRYCEQRAPGLPRSFHAAVYEVGLVAKGRVDTTDALRAIAQAIEVAALAEPREQADIRVAEAERWETFAKATHAHRAKSANAWTN